MKTWILTFIISAITAMSLTAADSVHDFTVNDIDGKPVNLKAYEGKVLLIVNVASECGATPQYETLQDLQAVLKDKGFSVLGFPANNYGGQEPGTEAEIKAFCTGSYSVDFPMFSKISAKGDDQAELFKYLTSAENPDFKGDIQWNFEKIVIGKDGKVARRFRTAAEPDSDEILAAIAAELKK